MNEPMVDFWHVLLSCSFIYETEHHNGIAELLEILGRYVSATGIIAFSKSDFLDL